MRKRARTLILRMNDENSWRSVLGSMAPYGDDSDRAMKEEMASESSDVWWRRHQRRRHGRRDEMTAVKNNMSEEGDSKR